MRRRCLAVALRCGGYAFLWFPVGGYGWLAGWKRRKEGAGCGLGWVRVDVGSWVGRPLGHPTALSISKDGQCRFIENISFWTHLCDTLLMLPPE